MRTKAAVSRSGCAFAFLQALGRNQSPSEAGVVMPCDTSVISVSSAALPLESEPGKEDSNDLPLARGKIHEIKSETSSRIAVKILLFYFK